MNAAVAQTLIDRVTRIAVSLLRGSGHAARARRARCRVKEEGVKRDSRLAQRFWKSLSQAKREQCKVSHHLVAAAKAGQTRKVRKLVKKLAAVSARVQALESAVPRGLAGPASGSEQSREEFVFSALLLKQTFLHCTETREEGMCFVLGFDSDGIGIATSVQGFSYAQRSVVNAIGDHRETQRIFVKAHEAEHRVLTLLHAHPGNGIQRPSGVDQNTQKAFESTTRMISGIWSRDGIIRFFSDRMQFKASVVGAGFKEIEENVFQIEDLEQTKSLAVSHAQIPGEGL